jgi:hypothetical protein
MGFLLGKRLLECIESINTGAVSSELDSKANAIGTQITEGIMADKTYLGSKRINW